MGGGGAPAPPDPVATANAQAGANADTARLQATINRYDQVTPYGNQTWQQDPNNPDKWTQVTTVDPTAQKLIDQSIQQSEALTGSVNSALDRVNQSFSQGINYSALPQVQDVGTLLQNGLAATPKADTAIYNNVADSVYNQATSRLDPQWQQSADKMNASLAAQGITQGSEAYNREMQNFNMAKNDAYAGARNSSITQADNVMQNQFTRGLAAAQLPTQIAQGNYNLENTARSNALNEQTGIQQTLLNQLNALRTGQQVQAPSFNQQATGTNVATTPVGDYINQAYQGQVANANAQSASNTAAMGTAGSVAAMALIAL